MMLIKNSHKPSVLFVGVATLLLLSACGKQGPKETPEQRAERMVRAAATTYKDELALITSEKNAKAIKKKLGKIIEDRPVKWRTMDTFNTVLVGKSYAPDKTPFHRYVEGLESSINALKKNEGFLAKFGFTALLEESKDVRCMLLEIKQHLLKHKEYKAEERYAALRDEMVSQRRY